MWLELVLLLESSEFMFNIVWSFEVDVFYFDIFEFIIFLFLFELELLVFYLVVNNSKEMLIDDVIIIICDDLFVCLDIGLLFLYRKEGCDVEDDYFYFFV